VKDELCNSLLDQKQTRLVCETWKLDDDVRKWVKQSPPGSLARSAALELGLKSHSAGETRLASAGLDCGHGKSVS
jgi:hypothetical protein